MELAEEIASAKLGASAKSGSFKDALKSWDKFKAWTKKEWTKKITLTDIMGKHYEKLGEKKLPQIADYYGLDKSKFPGKAKMWDDAVEAARKAELQEVFKLPKSFKQQVIEFDVFGKLGNAAGLVSDIFAIKNALDFLRAPHEDTNLGGAQAMLDRFSRILRDYNIGKMVYNYIFTHEESNSSPPLHKTQNLLKLLPRF